MFWLTSVGDRGTTTDCMELRVFRQATSQRTSNGAPWTQCLAESILSAISRATLVAYEDRTTHDVRKRQVLKVMFVLEGCPGAVTNEANGEAA